MRIILSFIFALALATACIRSHPPETGSDTALDVDFSDIPIVLMYHDTVYIPVYSAYTSLGDTSTSLTATLNIRNTSLRDTMSVEMVNYYNKKGELVREYLEKPIFLSPLETKSYTIPTTDTTNATEANFVIAWSAPTPQIHPVFQALMVSEDNQKRFAFTTKGISIGRK